MDNKYFNNHDIHIILNSHYSHTEFKMYTYIMLGIFNEIAQV